MNNLSDFDIKKFLESKNNEKPKTSTSIFDNLLSDEDREEIKKYRDSLIEEYNFNKQGITKKEFEKMKSEVEAVNTIISSNEVLFVIPYNTWWHHICSDITEIVKKLYGKVTFNFIAGVGVMISATDLKEFISFLIKYHSDIEPEFKDESHPNYYKNYIIFKVIGKGRNEGDIFDYKYIDKSHQYVIQYLCLKDFKPKTEKVIKIDYSSKEIQNSISNYINMNNNNIKNISGRYVSTKDIDDYFNLKSHIKTYLKLFKEFVSVSENASPIYDYKNTFVLDSGILGDENYNFEVFINTSLLDKVFDELKISEDQISKAFNDLNTLSINVYPYNYILSNGGKPYEL